MLKQDQALAIFNRATEEMRFYRNHQWQITYYTVLAYAALVVAPLGVPVGRWRNWVSWFSFFLVLLAAVQAGRTLYYSNDIQVTEHLRLIEVTKKEHLPLIHGIYAKLQPTDPLYRPGPVRILQRAFDLLGGSDPRPRFPRGLLLVVVMGAAFASLVILSRIRRVRRVFQRVRRFFFQKVPRFFARVFQHVRRFLFWWVPRFFAKVFQRVRWLSSLWVPRFFAWVSHWMPWLLAWISQWVPRIGPGQRP
jgi:hypothetical protein